MNPLMRKRWGFGTVLLAVFVAAVFSSIVTMTVLGNERSAPRSAPTAHLQPASTQSQPAGPSTPAPPEQVALNAPPSPVAPKPVERPRPPTAADALRRGVLIVVSLPRQRAFVFVDGQQWGTTPVSTGKPGHRTPRGVFPILEKARMHRSTLYESAPMPFMQRLTWSGVALHAGHVPGYPASHGCVRIPRAFARRLFGITNFSSVVVVTNVPIASADAARKVV